MVLLMFFDLVIIQKTTKITIRHHRRLCLQVWRGREGRVLKRKKKEERSRINRVL